MIAIGFGLLVLAIILVIARAQLWEGEDGFGVLLGWLLILTLLAFGIAGVHALWQVAP